MRAAYAPDAELEALQKAEDDGSQWHIQLEASQDQNERLRVEKANLVKQVTKLKSQLAAQSTMDSPYATAHSITPATGIKTGGTDVEFAYTPASSTKTPEMIRNKENSNNSGRRVSLAASGPCVICGKSAFGLMKRCSCGGLCERRAHLTCFQRSSDQKTVGQPGTLASPASFILCSAASPQAGSTES